MYIIACRAHFCHLPGLGQVGHSPGETSGSAGTLDWGPMWSGSQSTCTPNAPNTPTPPTLPNAPTPLMPLTPTDAPTSLTPCWPLSPYTPATPIPPDTPTPLIPHDVPWHPLLVLWTPTPLLAPNGPLTPLHPPACPWLTPSELVHTLDLLSGRVTIFCYIYPSMPPDTPYTPVDPWRHLVTQSSTTSGQLDMW